MGRFPTYRVFCGTGWSEHVMLNRNDTASRSNNPNTGSAVAGAQADFVATIGHRIAQIQQVWNAWLQDPGNLERHSELRRHIHALATRARLLRFFSVAEELEHAEHDLERVGIIGQVNPEIVNNFETLLGQLPDIAWKDTSVSNAQPGSSFRPKLAPSSPGSASTSNSVPPSSPSAPPATFQSPVFDVAIPGPGAVPVIATNNTSLRQPTDTFSAQSPPRPERLANLAEASLHAAGVANLVESAQSPKAAASNESPESTPKLPSFAVLSDAPSDNPPASPRGDQQPLRLPTNAMHAQPLDHQSAGNHGNQLVPTRDRPVSSSTPATLAPPQPEQGPSQNGLSRTGNDSSRDARTIRPTSVTECSSFCVLVIGPQSLADLVYEGCSPSNMFLEILRTQELTTAIDMTRAAAPDAIVIDADVPDVAQLCRRIAQDAIVEPTPVIVLGSWMNKRESQAFTPTKLFRALEKPVTPQSLGNAIAHASQHKNSLEPYVKLGTLTLDELAEHVGQQVRTGLVDSLNTPSRNVPIDLGQGTEVVAAVWSALARIRDVVTSQSKGAIHFDDGAPISTVAVAPSLPRSTPSTPTAPSEPSLPHGAPRADRRGEESVAAPPFDLTGLRILIADDDDDVSRFVAALFRQHDCVVQVAKDGNKALSLAYRFDPDLLITDILMPQLDGFELCNAFKQDILLRDVPTIVLSWKEDLLRRVRQIDPDNEDEMLHEAARSSIVRTAEKCLRPRTRIERRLRGQQLVRGRLDGLTGYTLLSLVQRTRPDARITVRDAAHIYTVQLRDRRLREVIRRNADGEVALGQQALLALVRTVTGRFYVQRQEDPVAEIAQPALDEVLVQAVAYTRSVQRFLRTLPVDNLSAVVLDHKTLAITDIVEPLRPAYEQLVLGKSPREIIDGGFANASILIQLLTEAAAHGAITAVIGADGTDLLESHRKLPVRSLSLRPSWLRAIHTEEEAKTADHKPALPTRSRPGDSGVEKNATSPSNHQRASLTTSAFEPSASVSEDAANSMDNADTMAPTCLEEAVIRQVSGHKSDVPSSAPSNTTALLASDLIPRSRPDDDELEIPSLPPDAIVPGTYAIEADRSDNFNEVAVPGVTSRSPASLVMQASLMARNGSETTAERQQHLIEFTGVPAKKPTSRPAQEFQAKPQEQASDRQASGDLQPATVTEADSIGEARAPHTDALHSDVDTANETVSNQTVPEQENEQDSPQEQGQEDDQKEALDAFPSGASSAIVNDEKFDDEDTDKRAMDDAGEASDPEQTKDSGEDDERGEDVNNDEEGLGEDAVGASSAVDGKDDYDPTTLDKKVFADSRRWWLIGVVILVLAMLAVWLVLNR